LGAGFFSASEDDLLDELAIDFTQLFHGPRDHIVSNESVQTGTDGGTLNGQATRRVHDFMDENDISLNEDCRELPDHISVEFEVMAELLHREAKALDQRQRDAAGYWERRQREFFDHHLGLWGPRFGKMVAERAGTAFYRELGGLMTNFLEDERSLLCQRLEDEAKSKEARSHAS
jgi:TorA maturation chaperone TorD